MGSGSATACPVQRLIAYYTRCGLHRDALPNRHHHHHHHHTMPSTTALADLSAARNDGKTHLLLAASGSVATIKIPNIIQSLLQSHPASWPPLSIRLILTSSAANFLAGQAAEQPSFQSLLSTPGVDGIYLDDDEWGRGQTIGSSEGVWRRGASILHIELRRWADLLCIVPLSANTLAKIVNGICDNLLTSVVRAWDAEGRVDGTRRRILAAPAMNVSKAWYFFFLQGTGVLSVYIIVDGHVAPPHHSQTDPRAECGLGRQGGRRRVHRIRVVRSLAPAGEIARVRRCRRRCNEGMDRDCRHHTVEIGTGTPRRLLEIVAKQVQLGQSYSV